MRQDVELIKLDFQATASDHFFAVGNFRDYHLPNPSAYQANAVATVPDRFSKRANWTRLIGNNKVNEFQFQFGVDSQPVFANTAVSAPEITSSTFTYGNADSSKSAGGEPLPVHRQLFVDSRLPSDEVRRRHQRAGRRRSRNSSSSDGIYS